jgi:hypothetical protein
MADKVFLGLANHASAALACLRGLFESQNHALPAGSHNRSEVPLLAGLDFFVCIRADIEVQAVECGDCCTPDHLRRRRKEPRLSPFLSPGFVFGILAARKGGRFCWAGMRITG